MGVNMVKGTKPCAALPHLLYNVGEYASSNNTQDSNIIDMHS